MEWASLTLQNRAPNRGVVIHAGPEQQRLVEGAERAQRQVLAEIAAGRLRVADLAACDAFGIVLLAYLEGVLSRADAFEAFRLAALSGDLLHAKALSREIGVTTAEIKDAASGAHIGGRPHSLLEAVAIRGHADVVQWLVQKFQLSGDAFYAGLLESPWPVAAARPPTGR